MRQKHFKKTCSQRTGSRAFGWKIALLSGLLSDRKQPFHVDLYCGKGVVDNTLTEYQKAVSFTTMFMVGFIILLFAGLFYSVSRLSIADQKAKYEKRNNELQIQAMKELEASNQNLKEAKNIATEALQTAENANKAKTDFLSNVSHDIRTPMNAIVGITALIRHNAGDKVKVLEYVDKIDISAQHLLGSLTMF